MFFIQNLLALFTSTSFFTGFVLVLAWFTWILLKSLHWAHPDLATLLIFSIAVLIPYMQEWYMLRYYCPELCATGLTFSFLVRIVFWFIVLYLLKSLIVKRVRPRLQG